MPPPYPIYPWINQLYTYYPPPFSVIPKLPLGPLVPDEIEPRPGDTVRLVPHYREIVVDSIDAEFVTERITDGSTYSGTRRHYSRKHYHLKIVKLGLGYPKDDPINAIRERLDGTGVWLKTGANDWKVLGGTSPNTAKDYFSNDQILQRMDTNGGLCTPCVGKVIGTLASRIDV